MGRFLLIFVALIVLVAAGAVGFVWLRGEGIITSGVSDYGPRVTGTPVTLGGVSLQPLGGKAGLNGFVVGMPEGYTAEKSISVDRISLDVAPRSLLSDTVKIRDLTVETPEIVVEPNRKGVTNLQAIQKNIEAFTGPAETQASGPTKKLAIDRLHIAAPRLRFSGGEVGLSDRTVELADITLTNIGVDEGGVPPGEVVRLISDALMPQVTKAIASDKAQEIFNKLTKGKVDLSLAAGNLEQQVKDEAKRQLEEQVGDKVEEKAKGLLDKLTGKKDKKDDKNGSSGNGSDSPDNR